jgi:hypothetical protein
MNDMMQQVMRKPPEREATSMEMITSQMMRMQKQLTNQQAQIIRLQENSQPKPKYSRNRSSGSSDSTGLGGQTKEMKSVPNSLINGRETNQVQSEHLNTSLGKWGN